MAKKNRKTNLPPPPKTPKWLENSTDNSPQKIKSATNARLAFRALRRASGLTQSELAQQLGVSLAAVQGAESGYRPITRELAWAVQAKLGVFAASVTGTRRAPKTLLGEKVSPESIKRVFEGCPTKLSDAEIEYFTKPLVPLLQAAAHAGQLRVFAATYRDTLKELRTSLNLQKSLEAVLQPPAQPSVKRAVTRKEVRESPDLAKVLEQLGVVDDPSRPDDETITTLAPPKPQSAPWSFHGPYFTDLSDFEDENVDAGEDHSSTDE